MAFRMARSNKHVDPEKLLRKEHPRPVRERNADFWLSYQLSAVPEMTSPSAGKNGYGRN